MNVSEKLLPEKEGRANNRVLQLKHLMKRNVLCAVMMLLAGSLIAADKDDVSAAIAKLTAADNYGWKTTTTNVPPPGSSDRRRVRQPDEGKALKSGLVSMTMPGMGAGTSNEVYMQGTNGAFQTPAGWQSVADGLKDDTRGGLNIPHLRALLILSTKTPVEQAGALLKGAKNITKINDAYVGELTDEGAKALLQPPFSQPSETVGISFERGGPKAITESTAPQITITDAKASVKYWIRDGILTKYEIKSKGRVEVDNLAPNDLDRTTTVEIKDVGSTKITIPDDAKKKMSR